MSKNREDGKWTHDTALDALSRNGIRPLDTVIDLGKHDAPGLTIWGAIDYLTHYCGFTLRREG